MEKRGILKEYLQYVSNNIISMIGYSLYILADTYFIAQGIGSNGLAALNIAIPLFNIMSGIGYLLGIGASATYTMKKAQGKTNEAYQVMSIAFRITGIVYLIFLIGGIFFSHTITQILGANSRIFTYTQTYIYYLLCFSGLFLLNYLLNNFVKNDNNPKLAMIAMLAGSLFNIVFDYYLIMVLHMGMKGAILATIGAPTIGILILSTHFIKHPLKLVKVSIYSPLNRLIIKIGLSSFISEVCVALMMYVNNQLFLSISSVEGVAAYGVIANIYIVVVCIYNGLAMGSQPLLSRYYALKDKIHLKQIKIYSTRIIFIFSLLLIGTVFFASNPIVSLFNQEQSQSLQILANKGMKLYFLGLFFVGSNIFHIMELATRENKYAHLFSLLRSLLFIMPITLIMTYFFKLNGLWLSLSISEMFIFILMRIQEKRDG